MNINFNSFINFISVFFNRVGLWFLLGESLAYYVCSGNISKCKIIIVGLIDVDENELLQRADTFGLKPEKIGEGCYRFDRNGYTVEIQLYENSRKNTVVCQYRNITLNRSWITASKDDIEELQRKRINMTPKGVWLRTMEGECNHNVNLPYCYGTILDNTVKDWFINTPKREYPVTGEIFFDKKRKENGRELIKRMYMAATKSGISDRLFAGFGTCLGYLMYGDFIAKDRDMDMCILSDGMTSEQYKEYSDLCYHIDVIKPFRWVVSKRNDNEYYWFSVGYKNPVSEYGCKSCNWFMFEWNNMLLHSKGGQWVNPKKMNQKIGYNLDDEAIALGQHISTIKGLTEVDFNGVKMNIPSTPGTACDHWYPGWCPAGSGASAHKNVIVIKKYANRNTWRLA